MSIQNIIFTVLAVGLIIFVVVIGGTKKTPVESTTPTITATTTAVAETKEEVTSTPSETKKVITAVMTTNKGVIALELYPKESPITVANFVKLAKEGFYNGTRFHRVISGFMIQGGDPLSKDIAKKDLWGTGGPGYGISDEFMNSTSELYKIGYKRGVIAMAHASMPNSGGSQFFIMHQDYPLPPQYTIFGKVTSGLKTVDKIASVETAMNAQGTEKSVPLEDLIVEKIEIK